MTDHKDRNNGHDEEFEALQAKLLELQTLEDRVNDLAEKNQQLAGQNTQLRENLSSARQQLLQLRAEVERLNTPPSSYGAFLRPNDDDTIDIVSPRHGRMRVVHAPNVDVDALKVGQTVVLNEALTVVSAGSYDRTGEVCILKDKIPGENGDPDRVMVVGKTDDAHVLWVSGTLHLDDIKVGDNLLMNSRTGFAFERMPKSEAEELMLEEVPDISYEDIGGLASQIEAIRDAVELPYLHTDMFRRYKLRAPKGVLLYGPPGCGKTLIAKAVANSLAKKMAEMSGDAPQRAYFLNVKGPELLNKYVGETERKLREVFQRAREKASEGMPVIVFFDEMESLFRTRGSGVSSDMESTIVPQLLSEIDGVESLKNVLVIGASNREDMIDPAVLRPGRLDVKIKVERPDEQAATDIFSKYLTDDLPLHGSESWRGTADERVAGMIHDTVKRMYSTGDENRFLEVTYQNGDKEILYFKDFNSGAMIENIVSRAKKYAIKEELKSGEVGIRTQHLLDAIVAEFIENEDLPNTTNPDDWARISGKKGERIVYIRTLINSRLQKAHRSIDDYAVGGQYL